MKQYFSEFLATFLLVFIGTGTVIWNDESLWNTGQLGIGIAFGVAVALGIFIFGKISGAQMNPAVTIALAIGKKIRWIYVPGFITGQLLGAISASYILSLIAPSNQLLGASLPSGTVTESFWFEFFLTIILMAFVWFFVECSEKPGWAPPLMLGLVVGLEAYFAGPICGASMNPARSIGPAVVSGHLEHLWIYIVATTAGASLVSIIWMLLKSRLS